MFDIIAKGLGTNLGERGGLLKHGYLFKKMLNSSFGFSTFKKRGITIFRMQSLFFQQSHISLSLPDVIKEEFLLIPKLH